MWRLRRRQFNWTTNGTCRGQTICYGFNIFICRTRVIAPGGIDKLYRYYYYTIRANGFTIFTWFVLRESTTRSRCGLCETQRKIIPTRLVHRSRPNPASFWSTLYIECTFDRIIGKSGFYSALCVKRIVSPSFLLNFNLCLFFLLKKRKTPWETLIKPLRIGRVTIDIGDAWQRMFCSKIAVNGFTLKIITVICFNESDLMN